MEANPCLLCLSANSKGGNVRRVSSLLNLVRAVQLTNVVPGDDDGGFVFCHVCDQLLDSATAISNSISQLQIKLRTKIDDIREIILNSEGNFGDSGSNLNVEISKTRKSFLECSENEDNVTSLEMEDKEIKIEPDFDQLDNYDENIGHDPLSPDTSVPEPSNEIEIGETEMKSETSQNDFDFEPQATPKRQAAEIGLSSDENEPKSKFPKKESPTRYFKPYTSFRVGRDKDVVNITTGDVYDDKIDFQELTAEIEACVANSSPSDPVVKLVCTSIRVGDYQCEVLYGAVPMFEVYITKLGIMFAILHRKKRDRLVNCVIPFNAILLVESFFSRDLSVLFIGTGPRYAKKVRDLLGLSEDPRSEGAFFCPSNGDQYQKRITLVAEEGCDPRTKLTIYKIFGRTGTNIGFQKAKETLAKLSRPCKTSTSKEITIPGPVLEASEKCENARTTLPIYKFQQQHENLEQVLTCPICKKEFKGKLEFEAHLMANHLHCDKCKQTFIRKRDLQRHMEQHEYEERTFVCKDCDKRFPNQNNLDAHITITHEESKKRKMAESRDYLCTICDKKFRERIYLIIHRFDEHETEDKPFSCKTCAKGFTLEVNLERHLRMHHSSLSIEIRPLTCETCDSRFRNKEALDKHNLKYHYKIFTCNTCQKQLRSFASLKTHLLAHSDQLKRHACPNCTESFTNKATLDSHQVKVHGKNPVICDECGSKHLNKQGLKKHKFTVHGGIRKYKCDICPQSFEKLSRLETHIRAHNNERPFICSFCGADFVSTATLRNHEKTIHCPDYTPSYKFSCQDCDKRFQGNRDLEVHIRRMHTGERPFACQQPNCDMKFFNKYGLVLHLKSKHGIIQQSTTSRAPRSRRDNISSTSPSAGTQVERPFACQQPNCYLKYSLKRSLARHLKTAHGIIRQLTTSTTSTAQPSKMTNISSPSSSTGTEGEQDSSLNEQNTSTIQQG